jgi:CRISPR/Cas system CMR-associated protein Cmr5 small subunit
VKTLAQIRAANALHHRQLVQTALNQPGQGDALSGFPMLIKTDGLLAALAFATEQKRNQQGQLMPKHAADSAIAFAIAAHLRHNQGDERIAITSAQNPDTLVTELTGGDAAQLRRATAEVLAFLNYLKRFVA